jgi:hypothetical protein
VNFSEERLNVQERALLLALHRGARWWRVAFWAVALCSLGLAWLVAGLAERLRETRASLESTQADLHQARLNFERCKGANRGLVEGLQEQQALIEDALRMAQRCERSTFFAQLPD